MTLLPDRSNRVRRLAVLAYHSSPLAAPGEGDSGGMTVYVRQLAETLARRGVLTDIFTRADALVPTSTTVVPGVRIVSVEAGPRESVPKERLPRHLDEFVRGVRTFSLAQRMTYDVVHSHYWQSGLAGIRLADAWGAPLVHSHHTLGKVKNNHLAPGDRPEPGIRLEGEARVISAADVLVASTDDEWKQLACLYGASHDRLKTLHPGVDHALFSPGSRDGARAALGLGDEAVMLYVGRIQRLKGIDLAIGSLAELKGSPGRNVTLVIAGGASGPTGSTEVRRLRDLAARLGVAESVRFVGAVPHSELPAYYRAADVLVVCSHSESFGLAALEAHSCGTPVVGTAVGGLSHIVADGRSGFLVDTRYPAVFARRVASLLSDDALRRRFGDAAIASAASFSWERTAHSLQELYECLVREQYPEACTC
ncbi:MAG: glycosyltransferase [Actinomycetota bacterium]|nr:glycosyltransferase [Actinomycetota bacterium]